MAAKPKTVENRNNLKDSAVRIQDSAAHMERSTARVEDSADRRTELAADRTVFAAERTYAAWVRTGLVAMASGIGAKALLTGLLPHWLVMTSGSVFILFSVFCFGAGVWRHLYPGPPTSLEPLCYLCLAFFAAFSIRAVRKGSAEREAKSLHARAKKLDFKLVIGN
jgi:putative membrane protein